MPRNPLDFGSLLEPILELRLVLLRPCLPRHRRLDSFARTRLPQSDVEIIRPRQHKLGVSAECHTKDPLHPLAVVDLPRPSLIVPKYPDRPIVGSRHKLSSCRREVNVHDSRHVILVHALCKVHAPHVKRVEVVVLVGQHKVEGLHGVPAHCIVALVHDELADSSAATNVMEHHASVRRRACQHVPLHWIEPHALHTLTAPTQRHNRFTPLVVPHLNINPTRGNQRL
mmetsp:Transcript_6052/g.14562  ORF Transcript_6052/g.14562 Transcript_6052/m.14562 type:complete len:227 (+) Transcript_6052:298-978(+)